MIATLKRRKRLILTVGVLVAVATAGLVYAAWTANGTGSGFAKADTAKALTTLDASAATSADLYPGATGDVQVKVNNTNSFPVRVTAVTGNGAIKADAAHSGCVTTGVTFTDKSNLTLDVPAGTATTFRLTGAVQMSNASDNGCQGATFEIPTALTAASNAA
jgi:hypothetical protein